MFKFLLDANISPELAVLFRKLGYETKSVLEEGWGKLSDREIIELAKRENRIIVTFDRDFAETWYFKEKGKIGILFLRTRLQTLEHVSRVISSFIRLKTLEKEKLEVSLVVLSEAGHRIARY